MNNATTTRTCDVETCAGPHYSLGYCVLHYSRIKRHGSVELPVRERPVCAIGGCVTAAKSRGWCNKHYLRWFHRGDPQALCPVRSSLPGPNHSSWRGDNVGFRAVHDRLVAAFGKASRQDCVDCGSAAREWSYRGGAPDEQASTQGPFTTDLTYYDPRCVRCHRRYDLGR